MEIARFFIGFNIFGRIVNIDNGGFDVCPPEMADGFDGALASLESVVDQPVAPIHLRPPFLLDLHGYFLYFSPKMKPVLKNSG